MKLEQGNKGKRLNLPNMVSFVCQWQQIIGVARVFHAACMNQALLHIRHYTNYSWNLISSQRKQYSTCFHIAWNTVAGKENIGNWDLGCTVLTGKEILLFSDGI